MPVKSVKVKSMAKWHKQTLKLKKTHGWKGKAGYKIFVADGGAVRFNFPQDWVVIPDSDSIKLHDKEPPEDNCRLAVSYLRLPPLDWSGLPLSQLVQTVIDGDKRDVIAQGEMVETARYGLEIAWSEFRFMDPNEGREAFSRICLGRKAAIQSLITFDFWAEDAAPLAKVWDEVLRSLELDREIKDPTVGNLGN